MKKYIYFVATLALGLGFTACEDVPAPYELPSEHQPAVNTDILINETFGASLGSFTTHTTDGAGAWVTDRGTARASGYDNQTKKTTAGTYYLVSEEVDLTNVEKAFLSFDYILRYNRGDENQQLLITDNYNAADVAANWTLLNQTWTESSDWATYHSYALNLPAAWMGKKVRIAFRYNTNATSGSTWQVKNFILQKGETSSGGGGEVVVPTGTNLLTNGDFETWESGAPKGWGGPANTATLAQNTTVFRSGTNAVSVAGDTKYNKRLASQAITLKPGTYNIQFFVRGETEGGSARPGYVKFENGAPVTTEYKYGSYTNNIPTAEWAEIKHSFTLTEQTTIALVVMNPKREAGAVGIIIDDFSLTTTDGGVVETPDNPTPNPPAGQNIYDKKLTDNADGWTFQNVTKPDALEAVWQQSAQYGLKGSAYAAGTRYATEAWAISPAIQLTQNNVLTFDHVQRYAANAAEELTLWVREGEGAWQQLPLTHSDGSNWTFIPSGEISLAAYAGKSIQLGFKYTSTETTAATWEFKNVVVK